MDADNWDETFVAELGNNHHAEDTCGNSDDEDGATADQEPALPRFKVASYPGVRGGEGTPGTHCLRMRLISQISGKIGYFSNLPCHVDVCGHAYTRTYAFIQS